MDFQIEDLVSMPDGIQGIVTSYKSQDEIVVVPLDKGSPKILKGSELKLIYSFLTELSNLKDNDDLQKILSMNEEMLKNQQSQIKERKKREKTGDSEQGRVEVDI
jgi:hypothetical protein